MAELLEYFDQFPPLEKIATEAILETTKHISLQVEHTGTGSGRFGDVRAGFEVSGKINRKDFGLNFHLLNDAGNLVVGDDIKIQCDIELIKQKEPGI